MPAPSEEEQPAVGRCAACRHGRGEAGHDGLFNDINAGWRFWSLFAVSDVVQPYRRRGRRRPMIVVMALTAFVFVYLVYALIHPERF